MKNLDKLPESEKLLSAILRKDKEIAAILLQNSHGRNFGEEFLADGAAGNICALVCEHIFDLNLTDEFNHIKLSDGISLSDRLKEMTTEASTFYARYDNLFLKLLNDLKELNEDVTWLKGTSLSRSLYPSPHFRLSQDFDILVRPGREKAVFERLVASGFHPVWNDPGLSHQYGVGPVGSLESLSITPSPELELCHNLSLKQSGWPYVEVKFDPLDRGLRTRDIDTFFENSSWICWGNGRFRAPSILDHLLICLTHFHKHGMQGWHWLYDIHLLSMQMNKDENSWPEFVNRCRMEQIELSARAGLNLSRDRLDTRIPQEVVDELERRGNSWLVNNLAFTINTEFLWNSASLPMLVFNMLLLGDAKRKQKALWQILFPQADFLARYYLGRERLNPIFYPPVLVIHWLVVLLPGGLVRRTFGKLLWPVRPEK